MEFSKMKELYWQLLQEFTHQHIKSINKYLADGNSRYIDTMYLRVDDNRFRTINKINISYFKVLLRKELSEFKNKDLLNELTSEIQKNVKFNFCTKTFDESINCHPSTVNNYIVNFIYRNIELDHYQNLYTEESFEQSFKELLSFMQSVDVNYKLYYPLHGCVGSEQIIDIKDITIKKAALDDCNFFDGYYNYDTPQFGLRTDLEIGDYYLVLRRSFAKKDWQIEGLRDSNTALDRIKLLLLLTSNGNVKMGRGISEYSDWTMYESYAIHGLMEPMNFINNKFSYNVDGIKDKLESNYEWIVDDKFELCKELQYALDWLKKSKQETDVNSKIVQLSLALEFSIKTDRNTVSKDLKNKSAILYSYDGSQNKKRAKNTIYDFYDLRSKIVHGSEYVEPTPDKLIKIDEAETIIRENLLLLCKLNQSHSFDHIFTCIDKVLSPPQPTLKSIIEK